MERVRDKIITAVENAHYQSRKSTVEQFWLAKYKEAREEVEVVRRRSLKTENELRALERRVLAPKETGFHASYREAQEHIDQLQENIALVMVDAREKEYEIEEWRGKAEEAEQMASEQERKMEEMKEKLDTLTKSLNASRAAKESLERDNITLSRRLEEEQHRAATELEELRESFQARENSLRVQVDVFEESALSALERTHAAERRTSKAEVRAEEAERRAEETERSLQAVERRMEEFCSQYRQQSERPRSEEKPFWVVSRDEIELTEREIGRGGWAAVRVANFRGTLVAAKCLHQVIISEYNRDLFIREMNFASRIRHPNLLQFIGATMQGELIILSELMYTSLRVLVEKGPLAIHLTQSIALDAARALNYLHSMQPDPIIHRDISSANILLEPALGDSWRAKVSDYGSVNFVQHLKTAGPGNPVYAAPEANTPAEQSVKMDIFSFGALLIEMGTGRIPDEASRNHLVPSIQHLWLITLVCRCIEEEREKRPTAGYIIQQLQGVHNCD